ncbi:simple sugar transport system permease protein [Paenibacillus anaericanus]|uniref:ABC transporter permease n=1 Tax=Paenibacillus anaericanus TaxID=170367 RepID=UPI002783F062|nr:ABC transporter permease [Paenibacillus anaericanus]MDQ0091046.1 simple sugar transport system permease protein [Paenibacillus anaericanus]
MKLNEIFKRQSLFVPIIAIVLGLVLGALVMLAGGYDPILAYQSMLTKIFGSTFDIGEAIRTIVPLVMCGLAVAISFRAGMFNIGVDGQIIMGSLGALIVGTQFNLPPFLHGLVAILVGALFGGLWGALVGYLKATKGISEVVTSIMLNFIALYFSQFMINLFMLQKGTQRSEMIHDSASIQISWLSNLAGGARIHWGFFIVILAVIFYQVYLNKTKWGYELRTVGLNPHAAKYAGMSVSRVLVRTMFISGVFGGLVGAFDVLGVFKYVAISSTTSGLGFDGIAVALLGGNTAIGVLLSGILIGALTYGSQGMSFGAGVPGEIIRMVIGFIIFFVAAPGIVKLLFRPFQKKTKKKV